MAWRNVPLQLAVIGALLALCWFVSPDLFGLWLQDAWLAFAVLPLVLVFAVIFYLCRPSVRQQLPLIYTLWAGNRALNRGDHVEAERLFRKAVAQAEGQSVNRDFCLGLALGPLAEVYRLQGRLADAEPICKQVLKHFDQETPNPTYRATAQLNRAAVYINRGRFAEAEPLCRDALVVLVNAGHDHRAVAALNLGQSLAGQEKYDEAERATRQALDMLAGKPGTCIVLSNLADFYRRQGRLAEAEPLARRALELFEQGGPGRDDSLRARFLNVLAEVLRLQGQLDEADSLCRQSETLIERAFGPAHIGLQSCLATRARIRLAQGQHAEAEPLLQRCLALLEPVVVPEHPERKARMEDYAALLRKLERSAEAEEWEARAKAISAAASPRATA